MTMIDAEACFAIWAPDDAVWSPWAKPAIFAAGPVFMPDNATAPVAPALDRPGLPEAWTPAAIIVDLPGADAVAMGLALAARGFRPVPLFNGTTGPMPVINNDPLVAALGAGGATLSQLPLKPDAKPAFLLDSRRMDPIGAGEPGRYDNRWVTLPQDFPSAAFLQHQGIEEVTLVTGGTPMSDISHVARRWQEAGLRMRLVDPVSWKIDDPYDVPVPSLFRTAWYAAATLMGLRRNNVGGFGSTVPEQTRSTGFYG